MGFEFSNDGFLPYESFDYIYSERRLPEFGQVNSPYCKEINTWRFYLANGEGEIPFGFESSSFDDSEWDLINVPSTWQTEGYGLPQNLIYNYPEELDKIAKRGEESISDKFLLHSSGSESDEFGIYRTSIVFSPEDIDRALYLETSGIAGSFNVYLNGKLVAESHAILTRKRLLLSDFAKPGVNQLTIIVDRWDRNKSGKIIRELMNYGFAGIFRPIYVVAESLVEISNIHLKIESVPAEYVNQLVVSGEESTALTVRENPKITKGNYLVKLDFKIRNHTDLMMPYSVRVSLLEARAEYDPYKLPYAKLSMQTGASGTIDGHADIRDGSEFIAIDVMQWSDATPVQYDVVLELLDSEDRVICAKKRRFGFRTTELLMDKFNINNKPVKIMAVKYYEFDPSGGITVPLDRFRQDIILMKRCGINTVIGQGFPLSESFLNLCDQYGIYVIAASDRRYMSDYVETHSFHPSIIMWGLNDYRFDASECLKTKADCRKLDETRPWYCGIDYERRVSDLKPMPCEVGAVFGPWVDLCLDREHIFAKNKTGKNLFETVPGRTRFPDDGSDYRWIHHADLVGGKQKENSSIGQGIVDSDRNPHPIYSDIKKQCEMVSIFSSPQDPTSLTLRNLNAMAFTPELVLEWKVMLGGHTIMNGKGNINEIEPYGTRTLRFPLNIAKYAVDGWAEGRAELIELYMKALSHELVFDISLKLAKDTYYAGEGYEIAFYQEVLAKECGNPAAPGSATLKAAKLGSGMTTAPMLGAGEKYTDSDAGDGMITIMDDALIPEETIVPDAVSIPEGAVVGEESHVSELINEFKIKALPDSLRVGNDDLQFTFNRKTGAVCGIKVGKSEFLKGNFMPSFYRCPSNIDRTDRSFVLAKTIFSKESDYEEIQKSLDFTGCNYGLYDGVFTLISRYKSFAMKGEVIVMYEIASSDKLRITLNFTPKYDMVRYGLRVPVTKEGVTCTWYGRGPGESYYDRKNATRFGLYAADSDKIYHPYARPAENSAHTDTSTMKLQSPFGDSLMVKRVSGEGYFEFTLLPFTPEQMNEYLHEEQLMQNDYCELFLDFCSKEIERTSNNTTALPLKKNVTYKETFEIDLIRA